jgi:hypothetical protein
MDFDIGNILYIVIMLVAVIVSLLGKKKKPAEGGTAAPGSEERPGFLENLERVLTMGQEPARVQNLQDFEADLPVEELTPKEAVEVVKPDYMNRPSLMEEYDRIMKQGREGGQDLLMGEGGLTDDALEVIDLDDLPGTDYFEIVRDFDAGTAVVYSAIINRLDY